ncbi:hypothetical protein JYK02_04680 [Corallococcus macrosporus]|uniref:Lipoprotein n=1 Tax=Corallococcus macrosporus TaxID=35 RepID=A0ABS3D6Z8_9BACT|nr:hypothetical protein [Corallococcus macrosporus]MBN8226801.1 hypothetical protein [Corallococcus macrosporus]
MDAAAEARLRELLTSCATEADLDVNLRMFNGKTPTAKQCQEQVGTDASGQPITRAMQLGQEKHTVALRCVQARLSVERPGGFSLEQRYRYGRDTKTLELISPGEEQALIRAGRTGRLRGTIVPDIVIHSGDPLRAEASYDFKFPCPIGKEGIWRMYPEGHPWKGRLQGEMYEEALGVDAFRVSPIVGVY